MEKKVTNLKILKSAAKKHGFKVGLIDSPYSQAIYVTNGEKQFISRSKTKYGMYPINPKFGEHLVDDKAVTKRFLKRSGFRVIKGKQFYISQNNPTIKILTKDRASASYEYAKKITYPVFAKPNTGSRGSNAKIILNDTALRAHVTKMRLDGVKSFLIEKFTQRNEYRIFVVGGKAQFMYKKNRPSITGTGEHTIGELLKASEIEPHNHILEHIFTHAKKTIDSILDWNKEITLQDTANISLGAEITDYREKLPKEIHSWCKRLNQVTGLEVFGVDIFAKGDRDDTSNYLIIEINSNPALAGIYNKGYVEKAQQIWLLIMNKFFYGRYNQSKKPTD